MRMCVATYCSIFLRKCSCIAGGCGRNRLQAELWKEVYNIFYVVHKLQSHVRLHITSQLLSQICCLTDAGFTLQRPQFSSSAVCSVFVVDWDLRKGFSTGCPISVFAMQSPVRRHITADISARTFLRRGEFVVRINRVYDWWWEMSSDVSNVAVNIGSVADI